MAGRGRCTWRRRLEVINFGAPEPGVCPAELISEEAGCRRTLLCRNRYFTTGASSWRLARNSTATATASLEIWGVVDGSATAAGLQLHAVQFTLLPAVLGGFAVIAAEARDAAAQLRGTRLKIEN